jgi:hypothetical protein
VAAGRIGGDERLTLDPKVVDFFHRRPHNPWEEATTLQEVQPGLEIVRAYLRMGRFSDAFTALSDSDLARALAHNLEALDELKSLLRPFFPRGWDEDSVSMGKYQKSPLFNMVAQTLSESDPVSAWSLISRNIKYNIENNLIESIKITLLRAFFVLNEINNIPARSRIVDLRIEVCKVSESMDHILSSKVDKFYDLLLLGELAEAGNILDELRSHDEASRDEALLPGTLEVAQVEYEFRRGTLTEQVLAEAERAISQGRSRYDVRRLHDLRGQWKLDSGDAEAAVPSLSEAVRMAREVGIDDYWGEAMLAVARVRMGERFDAHGLAEHLAAATDEDGLLPCAELWLELGARDRATELALRAHRWATGNGLPFVRSFTLDRATRLLERLGIEPPAVPECDLTKYPPFPWEADIRALLKSREEKRQGKNDE